MPAYPLLVTLIAAALGGCATTAPLEPTEPVAQDQRPPQFQPKRVGPSAMEAWIAPWEDATGDLYPPASVYIEVNRPSWQYGDGAGRVKVLRPLQVEQRSSPALPAAPLRGAPAVDLAPTFKGPAQGA
jgi:conjugal transfer pilus assembly protein TraV